MSLELCAFILSYKRAANVVTYKALRRHGFTGRIFIIVDDGDPQLAEYQSLYGEQVKVFSKDEVRKHTDTGDNFAATNTVLFARNVCWHIAKQVKVSHFVMLDDDYGSFLHRYDDNLMFARTRYANNLDAVFAACARFADATNACAIALAQGGDFIGGCLPTAGLLGNGNRRKAMNAFVCATTRPFMFIGRMNDDVNTYVRLGNLGNYFATTALCSITQKQTQQAAGGLTDMYLAEGTYKKSFYSCMYMPSSVAISVLCDARIEAKTKHSRFHHKIKWRATVPRLLRESIKKRVLP
jgi:hypothetical protein